MRQKTGIWNDICSTQAFEVKIEYTEGRANGMTK